MQEKDKNGLVKTGEYTAVNPNFQAPVNQRVLDINAEIARQGNKGYSVAPNTTDSQGNLVAGSQPITSATLSNSETPITLPEQKPSTFAAGLTGETDAMLELSKLRKEEAQKVAEQEAKLAENQSKQSSILERIGFTTKDVTERVEKEKGIPAYREELQRLEEDLTTSRRKQLAELKALEGQNMTASGSQAAQQGIERKYALEQSDLKFEMYLRQDRIDSAEKIIADKIKLETEPLYAQLDLTKDVYSQISQSLSKSEDREWNLAIDTIKQGIKEKEDLVQYKGDIAITASKNGTPLDSYTQMKLNRAKTMDEVNQVLADSGVNLAKPASKSGVGGTFGGTEYASDLDAIIGATLSTIPTKFGQQTFNEQIARTRNDADKISLVAAQVLKGQPAEFKNDFRNQAVGISMIDKAIAELDKGTQTGAIQAGKQYAANFLGKDYDPALAKIEGYITSAIQPYRNSVTGAAWGEQEDNEYASLFGSTKYSPTELRQRLLQTKELLKSKSAEGLNAFVNPLGTYDNQFNTGTLAPSNQNQNPEDIWNEVISGKAESSSWIKNAWNSLFN